MNSVCGLTKAAGGVRLSHPYSPYSIHSQSPPSPSHQVEGSDFGVLLRSQRAVSEAAAALSSGGAPALLRLSAEDLALLQSGPRWVSVPLMGAEGGDGPRTAALRPQGERGWVPPSPECFAPVTTRSHVFTTHSEFWNPR